MSLKRRKILIVANVDNFHVNFHLPLIKKLSKDWDVDIASNGQHQFQNISVKYHVPFGRNPFDLSNFKALSVIKNIISKCDYDIIFCHTPIVGFLTRYCLVQTRKRSSCLIYSAHGYSFYSGSSLISNLIYKRLEKFLSSRNDVVITMNSEDYHSAKKYNLGRSIVAVNGVGLDLAKFSPITRDEKFTLRTKFNFDIDDFILVYPAEFTKRKNQKKLISIFNDVRQRIDRVHLILIGQGDLLEECKNFAFKLGADKDIHFLGYRNDVDDLLKCSDLLVTTSISEGLPVCVQEALASGLPVVASKIRGHTDLIVDNENGFLVDLKDNYVAVEEIVSLARNKELYERMSINARKSVHIYDSDTVSDDYIMTFENAIEYSMLYHKI